MKDKRKSKVLIYCTRLLDAGGIESHVRSFVNELSNDLEIYLLVLDSSLTDAQQAFYKAKCKRVWIIKKGKFIARFLFLFPSIIRMRMLNFDYFYSNGQGDSIKLMRKLLGKNVFWVHHHHTAVTEEISHSWSKEYMFTLQNADTLNACSKTIAAKLEEITLRKVISVPCFSYSTTIAQKNNIEYPIKLGFYGRLIPEKGINQLCRISKSLDPSLVELHIWGSGITYDKQFFTQYPKINYHGTFSGKKELSIVLNSIDAYILISEHPEGLPVSLLEVMGTGKPWIATNIGGIKDIVVDDTRNYLLPQNLPEADLIKHLNKFTQGLIGKSKISDLQIEYYNKLFSPKKLSFDWLNIFSN